MKWKLYLLLLFLASTPSYPEDYGYSVAGIQPNMTLSQALEAVGADMEDFHYSSSSSSLVTRFGLVNMALPQPGDGNIPIYGVQGPVLLLSAELVGRVGDRREDINRLLGVASEVATRADHYRRHYRREDVILTILYDRNDLVESFTMITTNPHAEVERNATGALARPLPKGRSPAPRDVSKDCNGEGRERR